MTQGKGDGAGLPAPTTQGKGSGVDELQPSMRLLVKLGSIAVHAQELQSDDGRVVDAIALAALLEDPEVLAWIEAMGALLPVKRKG